MCDYKGKPVHVIQIGLGTFDTFLHDDAAWIDVLLQATSRRAGDKLKAIGVDPVEESAGPLEQLAMEKEQHYVSIMLAAVGEETGTVSLFCLPHTTRLKMREELEHRRVDALKRANVDWSLSFLENMSSTHRPHPEFHYYTDDVYRLSKTNQELMERREVQLITYAGILRKPNSRGCEVLIIDAEGTDCAILRSMIHTGTTSEDFLWPLVICFEIQGHGDVKERKSVEESTVRDLQSLGYLLLHGHKDATLVYSPALHGKLRKWANKLPVELLFMQKRILSFIKGFCCRGRHGRISMERPRMALS